MNHRPAALLLALAAIASSACNRHASEAPPPPRPLAPAPAASPATGALETVAGDTPIDQAIRAAQEAVRRRPGDAARYVTLARAFVQKARTTEDPGWYAQANDAVQRGVAVAPGDPDIDSMRALLFLQDHRFREAADVARAVTMRAPGRSDAYGALSDALMELGDYDGAVDAAQHMVDARPDGAAYVRVAWLRWLHGDPAGALEVMHLAVDALPRQAEARAWIVAQMGVLYWNTGDLAQAQRWFDGALTEDAGFSLARAGRARVALARGDAATAVTEATAAADANPTAENVWLAGDALAAAGRADDAARRYASLERMGVRTDPRSLSLYYSTTNQHADRALELARAEYARRQDVFTEDALAWALFRNGNTAEARASIARARRLDTRDARMLYHEGVIRRAAGDRDGAVVALRAALTANPFWNAAEVAAARHELDELGASTTTRNDAAARPGATD